MRVGFLTPDLASGYGWARYAQELAGALAAHGVEVVALTQPQPTSAPGSLRLADVRPVLPLLVPPGRGFMLRSLLGLPRISLALRDCDALHVIAEPYTLLAHATAGKRPVIVTAHGTYVPQTIRRALVGPLYRRAYQHARLITVSAYTAAQVRQALPGSEPVIIHNGVNVARFQQAAPVPAKQGPTILAAGGVKPRKGTHLLVEALAQVRATVPDAQLVVTGTVDDSDYVHNLHARITELELQDAVRLVGRIPDDDLRGWYQHADVFALPSLNIGQQFEGFGLVFLEAGACGLPVVGTSGSGAAEAIRDGETGLVVPQDDVPALSAALTRLLADDDLRARMGSAGRVYAQTQDWSQIAARVMTLYTP